MNIAYDRIVGGSLIVGSTTDAQAPGMYAYTDTQPCKTCGGPHKTKWQWRKVLGHRHQASWVPLETWEEGLALIRKAKRRWVGKGSLLIQWYGTGDVPAGISLFFVPRRKAHAVNETVPKGYPTSV